jgi:hypothetical protein
MWKKVSKECYPGRMEIVWGLWKGRHVTVVWHDCSYEEILNNALKDPNWFCAEEDKYGCVTYWKEIERPEPPEA